MVAINRCLCVWLWLLLDASGLAAINRCLCVWLWLLLNADVMVACKLTAALKKCPMINILLLYIYISDQNLVAVITIQCLLFCVDSRFDKYSL